MIKKVHPLKLALLLSAIGLCFLIEPCPHGGVNGHSCWVHPTASTAMPMGSKYLPLPDSALDSTHIQIKNNE